MTTTYNGWKNYETWNVALWMQNDEGFYGVAQQAEEIGDYIDFLFTNGHTHTPDVSRLMALNWTTKHWTSWSLLLLERTHY